MCCAGRRGGQRRMSSARLRSSRSWMKRCRKGVMGSILRVRTGNRSPEPTWPSVEGHLSSVRASKAEESLQSLRPDSDERGATGA